MRQTGVPWSDIMNALEEFYREVDQSADELSRLHASRLHCKQGCIQCCMDGITVFEVEARTIREHYADLLTSGLPFAGSACVFLNQEGMCRIYQYRPYVCRTQGLPLRWMDETEAGDSVEMRDICPVNESGPAIVTLPEEQCWTIGPFELRLAALQTLACGNEMVRVPLRSLFKSSASPEATEDVPEQEAEAAELDVEISAWRKSDEQAVIRLLTEAGLCTADLTPEKIRNFLVARTEEGNVIGAVGCEVYGTYGLLRSLVVHPTYQGAGLGTALIDQMEAHARSQGITSLYLLTISAAEYFLKLGFQITQRTSAPECIASTEEFRNLCPVSAVCMWKHLERRSTP